MDWNPYSPPKTSEQEKSFARTRLIIHCVGLVLFSLLVWTWFALFTQGGLAFGAFFFGAVLGLILWLWNNDENHSLRFMFSGSLLIGVIGFAFLAPLEVRNAIVKDIVDNPLTMFMLLFGFSLFAGFNTAALLFALWVWNVLIKSLRWILSSLS